MGGRIDNPKEMEALLHDLQEKASAEATHHKIVGRKAVEIPTREWPVVTQAQLRRASDLGDPQPDENPLVKHLTVGYVLASNALLNLRRARKLAVAAEKPDLVARIDLEIRRLIQVREDWPLTLV